MTKTPFQHTISRRTATTEQLHRLEDVLHPYNNINDVGVAERDEKTVITVEIGYSASNTLDGVRYDLNAVHEVVDTFCSADDIVDSLCESTKPSASHGEADTIDPDEAYVRTLSDNASVTLHYNYESFMTETVW